MLNKRNFLPFLFLFFTAVWADAATTVRSSNFNTAATGTAVTVTAPSGTVPGDIVVVWINSNGGITHIDNNGATPFIKRLSEYSPTTATITEWSRRIQSGDPSTYAWTLSASNRWTIIAVTFQNPNSTTTYDILPVAGNSGTATTGTAISIITITNSAHHLAAMGIDSSIGTDTITGGPAGYTLHQNGGNQKLAVASKIISPAGATGAQTFTLSGALTFFGVSSAIRDEGLAVTRPPRRARILQ